MALRLDDCNCISIHRNHPIPGIEKIIASEPGQINNPIITAINIFHKMRIRLPKNCDVKWYHPEKWKNSVVLKIVYGSEKVGERTRFYTWTWYINTTVMHTNKMHHLSQIRINTPCSDDPNHTHEPKDGNCHCDIG